MPLRVDLFFIELDTYTVFVLLGIGTGWAIAFGYVRLRARRTVTPSLFLETALVVLAVAYVGARAYHVVLNWEYYSAHPEQIAQFGAGGLAMRGAFLAGTLALGVYARLRRLRVGKLADAAALGLAAGQAIGWVGALVRGTNYGVVSDVPFALELADMYGLLAPRFPLQHFHIGAFALVFILLVFVAMNKPRPGTLFWAYVGLTAATNAGLGFYRGDETCYLGVLRVDQGVDLGLLALSVSVWVWHKIRIWEQKRFGFIETA